MQSIWLLLAVALSAFNDPAIYAEYEKAEKSIDHLDSKTFLPTISQGMTLVFLGAEWCGHCQKYIIFH
jgi:hypothetical protein